MTASLRGILILNALLLITMIGFALAERSRDEVVRDRSIVTNLDTRQIDSVEWRSLNQDVRPPLVRSNDGWSFGPAEPPIPSHTMDDFVAALRGGRWHRRAAKARAGHIQRWISITAAGRTFSLAIGEPLPGANQTWILNNDNEALLVDDWIVRALSPTASDFYDPFLFANAANAKSIQVGKLALESAPWRSRDGVVVAGLADALFGSLAALELKPTHSGTLVAKSTIAVDGRTASVGGDCEEGGVAIQPAGHQVMCVAPTAWARVASAVAAFDAPAADVIDRRPAGFTYASIAMTGGELLPKKMQLVIGNTRIAADPQRITELVESLATPGELASVPSTAPQLSLELAPITLEVFADRVHRKGETFAISITPAQHAIFMRTIDDYRDTERWSEEPSTITAITLDDKTFTRGAVLGEWSNTTNAASVENLAIAVAKLHAPARSGTVAPTHHLIVTFTPPVGPAVTHRLDLGANCAAVVDGTGVTLPAALCSTLGTAVAASVHQ